MKKLLVAIYNKNTKFYESDLIYTFYNDEQAYAELRRAIYAMYADSSVPRQYFREMQYREIGIIETRDGTIEVKDDDFYVPFVLDLEEEYRKYDSYFADLDESEVNDAS